MRDINDIVMVDYLRTPFSRSRPREPERDLLNCWRGDELLAILMKELIKKNKINPEEIDEVITGCATAVWENWSYGAKFPLFLAELPFKIASHQIDQQCASSMMAIRAGVLAIAAGYADIVFAGGYEHMTHVPMGGGQYVSQPPEFSNHSVLPDIDFTSVMSMGLTAEKLFTRTKNASKEEMDQWSMESHLKAAKAQAEGYFKGEILPIEVTLPDGKKQIVDRDLSVRADTTMEGLRSLKPAFKPDGVITAGNSSPLNAGASMTVLMSREKAKKMGLKPMCSFVSFGTAGVDPTVMGMGPVPASQKALANAKLSVKDIDFWEINEAFAIVPVYAVKELGLDPKKVNIKGGGVAIGHPLGASGARITGTLARILREKNATYGLATLCVGGGQGHAVIIKKE